MLSARVLLHQTATASARIARRLSSSPNVIVSLSTRRTGLDVTNRFGLVGGVIRSTASGTVRDFASSALPPVDSNNEEHAAGDEADLTTTEDELKGGGVGPSITENDDGRSGTGDYDSSILSSLGPSYRPGQALHALRQKGKGATTTNSRGVEVPDPTRKKINQLEFLELCRSCRPFMPKDTKVVLNALREFRRTREFILEEEGARAAVSAMLRAMLPQSEGGDDGKKKIDAALLVLEAFVDETTGLYYSCPVEDIDGVFDLLLSGLIRTEVTKDKKVESPADSLDGSAAEAKEGDAEGVDGNDENESSVSDDESPEIEHDEKIEESAPTACTNKDENIQRLTKSTLELLRKRSGRPDRKMKKRAARRYRKHLKVSSGPTTLTKQLSVQILERVSAT